MNRTLSFVALDFRSIKPYVRTIMIMPALGMIAGFAYRSSIVVTAFFMLACMLMMPYPFSIGEKSRMDTLYGTLPMRRNTVVLGRYLFVLILEVVCAALSLLIAVVVSGIYRTELSVQEMIVSLILLALFSVIAAIQYPIYFKLGYNKARTYAMIPTLVVFLGIGQIPNLLRLFRVEIALESVMLWLQANALLVLIVPIAIGMIALMVSYWVSSRIYAGRDL